jgi:putative membrane-bound dehydrogenase-like protein
MKSRNFRYRRIRLALAAAGVAGMAVFVVSAQSPARPGSEPPSAEPRPIKVLFLGHDQERPHPSPAMYPLLAAPLARRGIQLTHVLTPAEALNPEKLAHYDALMIYGNHEAITPEQEKTLINFVEGGKGVVAIHSASAMFPKSDAYISLIGGQFQRHGTGEFTAEIVKPDHPVMKGVQPFQTWDETYVHVKHNTADRTVLMERADDKGREPWTWVRTQGKGRVFYTAYGHDQRTWGNPGFHELIQNGVTWAVDETARRCWEALKVPDITYVEGFNVPNYENRDPVPKYQLPLPSRESMKFIQIPAEFNVELFASEPEIIKPLTFSFDERGRLWVVETYDYPNEILDGQPGDDRIKILEDTNGDGRADKVTVFADHLNIPTSLVFANGGVIVAQAPNFLFLKDTDGDDRADVREVLMTGWGTRDTHAGPSNLQYAPDNHIWGVVGYSGFEGELGGKRFQFNQAVYRFKPDGSGFEQMTGSTNNTWGLGFSETFDVFGSTANNDPSFYMAIPNRYFEGIRGLPTTTIGTRGPGYQSAASFYGAHFLTPYIRQVDVHGGYTAAAGHYLYTARSFPKDYWNRIAFINEPTAHLIGQGIVDKQGAGFVTRDGWNLLASADEWVAPVHTQVGPDGAVWVADWYNFITQHNPTPTGYSTGRGNAYESSLRDHLRGRIYRITYKNAPRARTRSLSRTDPAGLIDALGADNMFWRLAAQRLIVERGQKDLVPQLIALVRNTAVDAVGINGGAFHALWTLHGLGELSGNNTEAYRAAVEALKHPAAGVRKAAAMVLPRSAEAGSAILDAGLLQDRDLHTRLAATLVLADMPSSAALGQALYKESQKSENYGDRWLSRAFYIAATRHKDHFLTMQRSDPKAVPFTDLPAALRLGATKPDWRVPSAQELSTAWKDMQVPGNWEARGLPDFDGVVWFTRQLSWPADAEASSLTLGRVGNMAEVWINGLSVTPTFGGGRGGAAPPTTPAPAPPEPRATGRGAGSAGGRGGTGRGASGTQMMVSAAGRGSVPPSYVVPPGTFRAGQNTITVRIQNNRNDGGFLGPPESMYIEAGDTRVPLEGTWKHRVERQTNAGALYSKPGELAAHVAFTASGGTGDAAGAALPAVAVQAPDVVLRLGVIAGQMKFDRSDLTVGAGQLVEIVFSNADQMQHNFLIGSPGSLEQIGAAADALATSPNGLAQQYVPDTPQVLVATKLVEPGQTVTLQFKAPEQPGQYPYVCTFPAHWRIMNGVLNVVAAGGRGGR